MNRVEENNFDGSLWRLARELDAVDTGKGEWAVFGSASLVVRGVIDRMPGDIDVFVSKRVWGKLLPRERWIWETPNRFDPPILTYDSPIPLHLFFEWRDDNVDIDVPSLLMRAEATRWPTITRDVMIAPLYDVERHKQAALNYGTLAVQKHKPDLEAIKAWKGGWRPNGRTEEVS